MISFYNENVYIEYKNVYSIKNKANIGSKQTIHYKFTLVHYTLCQAAKLS